MGIININGKIFAVEGDSVRIVSRNGTVSMDGRALADGLPGTVILRVEGAVASIQADGDVTCGDVTGPVDAGGSVHCGNVAGDVAAGGSVMAHGIASGSIDAGGSVRIGR